MKNCKKPTILSNCILTSIVLTFNVCICVCCDSRSLDRHPKSEGWQVWVALREAVHPAILSSLPHPQSVSGPGPIWGPCVTNRWASHKRTPRPAKPVSCTPD